MGAPTELYGWLLDVYSDEGHGVVVWLVGVDGLRHRLHQDFAVTFYAAGPADQLRALWKHLEQESIPFVMKHTRQQDLYGNPLDCLEIEVPNAALQPKLFRRVQRAFPGLDYYNADIALPIRFHTRHRVFPLAHCRLTVGHQGAIHNIEALESPWSLRAKSPPPLRILTVNPSSNPSRSLPAHLKLRWDHQTTRISTAEPARLLAAFKELLQVYDPDIIISRYGDKWLFPYLLAVSKEHGIPFNPNRDRQRRPIVVAANTFSSYGRIVQRDSQTLLRGRVHLDPANSMSFKDFGLTGACELARVTGLPLQNAARRSPGGGFTAMQVRAALERGILLPLNKKRHEKYKSAAELLVADNGGLVYQPLTGLHTDVAEIDFFSMYPSLMSTWNISPETVNQRGKQALTVPALNRPITLDQRGVVAAVLEPVLDKRARAKQELKQPGLSEDQKHHLKAVAETLKWLGWVSFGYQGFSGNRIGSIEAHESINAISRELLLRAKEVAEEQGFTVLHMYVDSLFVRRPGWDREAMYAPLIEEMNARTGLTVELEGIFNWMAFLPSKTDADLPVPNCYFGAFQNGGLKCRGIMARRGDTPFFIENCQMRAIKIMARAQDRPALNRLLPKLVHYFKTQYRRMVAGGIPSRELRIAQRLSRELADYRVISAAGRAAKQLAKVGKTVRAGQTVEYLRVLGRPDVLAWDLVGDETDAQLDLAWYRVSFLRAAHELLQVFGVDQDTLALWLDGKAAYFRPEDYLDGAQKELPLLELINEPPETPAAAGSLSLPHRAAPSGSPPGTAPGARPGNRPGSLRPSRPAAPRLARPIVFARRSRSSPWAAAGGPAAKPPDTS